MQRVQQTSVSCFNGAYICVKTSISLAAERNFLVAQSTIFHRFMVSRVYGSKNFAKEPTIANPTPSRHRASIALIASAFAIWSTIGIRPRTLTPTGVLTSMSRLPIVSSPTKENISTLINLIINSEIISNLLLVTLRFQKFIVLPIQCWFRNSKYISCLYLRKAVFSLQLVIGSTCEIFKFLSRITQLLQI